MHVWEIRNSQRKTAVSSNRLLGASRSPSHGRGRPFQDDVAVGKTEMDFEKCLTNATDCEML